MDALLKYVESWHSLVLVLVVFGFAPGFCLRLIVLAYPRTDPRRRELIAELYAVPRAKRPLWVAEQLEVALFEGLAHSVSAAIRRRTAQRQTREKINKRGQTQRWTKQRWVVGAGLVVIGSALLVSEHNASTSGTYGWVLAFNLVWSSAILSAVAFGLLMTRRTFRRSRGLRVVRR